MSIKRDEYYWIEGKDGKLVKTGRSIYGREEDLVEGLEDCGLPEMQESKEWAKVLCRKGERPVKVRLVKAEE